MLSDEICRAIALDIRRGATTKEVAKKFGVHEQTLYAAKRKGRIPRNSRLITEGERKEIVILLYYVPSISEIARIMNRHRHSIKKIAETCNKLYLGRLPDRAAASSRAAQEERYRIMENRHKFRSGKL